MCQLMVLNLIHQQQHVVFHRVLVRLLLVQIYTNGLWHAIRFSHVRHFAGDTNLLHINKFPRMLNKLINYILQNLSNWLNASKITLNVRKTELVIFKPKRKKVYFEFKIRLNDKKLFQTNSVKY